MMTRKVALAAILSLANGLSCQQCIAEGNVYQISVKAAATSSCVKVENCERHHEIGSFTDCYDDCSKIVPVGAEDEARLLEETTTILLSDESCFSLSCNSCVNSMDGKERRCSWGSNVKQRDVQGCVPRSLVRSDDAIDYASTESCRPALTCEQCLQIGGTKFRAGITTRTVENQCAFEKCEAGYKDGSLTACYDDCQSVMDPATVNTYAATSIGVHALLLDTSCFAYANCDDCLRVACVPFQVSDNQFTHICAPQEWDWTIYPPEFLEVEICPVVKTCDDCISSIDRKFKTVIENGVVTNSCVEDCKAEHRIGRWVDCIDKSCDALVDAGLETSADLHKLGQFPLSGDSCILRKYCTDCQAGAAKQCLYAEDTQGKLGCLPAAFAFADVSQIEKCSAAATCDECVASPGFRWSVELLEGVSIQRCVRQCLQPGTPANPHRCFDAFCSAVPDPGLRDGDNALSVGDFALAADSCSLRDIQSCVRGGDPCVLAREQETIACIHSEFFSSQWEIYNSVPEPTNCEICVALGLIFQQSITAAGVVNSCVATCKIPILLEVVFCFSHDDTRPLICDQPKDPGLEDPDALLQIPGDHAPHSFATESCYAQKTCETCGSVGHCAYVDLNVINGRGCVHEDFWFRKENVIECPLTCERCVRLGGAFKTNYTAAGVHNTCVNSCVASHVPGNEWVTCHSNCQEVYDPGVELKDRLLETWRNPVKWKESCFSGIDDCTACRAMSGCAWAEDLEWNTGCVGRSFISTKDKLNIRDAPVCGPYKTCAQCEASKKYIRATTTVDGLVLQCVDSCTENAMPGHWTHCYRQCSRVVDPGVIDSSALQDLSVKLRLSPTSCFSTPDCVQCKGLEERGGGCYFGTLSSTDLHSCFSKEWIPKGNEAILVSSTCEPQTLQERCESCIGRNLDFQITVVKNAVESSCAAKCKINYGPKNWTDCHQSCDDIYDPGVDESVLFANSQFSQPLRKDSCFAFHNCETCTTDWRGEKCVLFTQDDRTGCVPAAKAAVGALACLLPEKGNVGWSITTTTASIFILLSFTFFT